MGLLDNPGFAEAAHRLCSHCERFQKPTKEGSVAVKKTSNPRRAKPSSQKKSAPGEKSQAFTIVGIGASAGGLKAFEQFFANLPPDSGAAFVLVPHLDPSHVSVLPDLLRKYTKMPVVQAEDGMKILANRVHVIAPNCEMVVMHGTLLLKRLKEPRGLRLPIDMFFRSLAEDRKDKAVCIILSGNGTDGSLGLRAVKAELGLAIVQDPDSAEYDSMPRSAIETGLVDYILPPEKMAAQLVTYLRHAEFRHGPSAVGAAEKAPESLQKIFQLLRSRTSHDFSFYKKNTLCRRIERRMSVHQIENLSDYAIYLDRNPQEVVTLFKELLIGVTNFFRDPQGFAALSSCLRSEVLADKPKDYTIRVWVPGCSSGEEVYSIAIILRECSEALKKTWKIQIFGTDIDDDAINAARAGLYPASVAADVPTDRLKRYFVAEGNAYRIKKEIREMVVFATQDLLKDPPFTKLDLLSCRNLLIYLEGELQKKLLPLFHYALKPDGILFLGPSESINGFTDLFSVIDRKWKIFRRRASSHTAEAFVPLPAAGPRTQIAKPAVPSQKSVTRPSSVADVAQKLLMDHYAPPAVFIDHAGEILYTHGRTGKYLELAQGHAHLNVLEMAREGLRHEVAAAIRKARLQRQKVTLERLQVKTNGGFQWVNMTVTPVHRQEGIGETFMVVFEDVAPKPMKTGKTTKAVVAATAARRIAQIEQELRHTQEHLQTTIEELETSNEELKSSNEELQSTNEELQSTNEELETSKEELQSLNEELVTVNAELQGKIEELSNANDDMKNLLDSTKIATIFVDNHLCIKRFTSEATKIINLIQSDVGRPISHIVSNLEHESLAADAQEVIDSLVPKERPVRTKEGRWYLNRIIPYRTLGNVIDGVVITFTDISEQKIAEAAIDARNLAEGIVETVREPLMVLDRNLKVIAANSAFCRLFQVTADGTVGREFFALGDGQWNIAQLRDLLENLLPHNTQINEFIIEHDFHKVGRKKLSFNARRIHRESVGTETILLTIKDITAGE
jgi:two-component system, chemotaxis family, CheB/CheR fusion protein